MKKSFLQSRTVWVNILIAITTILPELIDMGFHIPLKWIALITMLANIILRFMTKDPVGLTSQEAVG